jgi:hypothetical protein
MASPKPSELLARSLKLFGPNGEKWVQEEAEVSRGGEGMVRNDTVYFPQGAFCSIGAIEKVNTQNEYEAKRFLILAIDRKKPSKFECEDVHVRYGAPNVSDITDWNDESTRTFDQVRRKFLKAIRLAKSVGR